MRGLFVVMLYGVAMAQTPSPLAQFIRENYSNFEYRVAARDGAKLFTSVYIPKDVFSEGKTYPILMQRTP